MKRIYATLFGRVLLAGVIGILIGILFPKFAVDLMPLSEIFIKLIKMIIGPLVFCVVVGGMARTHDLKMVGRVGIKAIVYFELITFFALFIGGALAFIFHPGSGMNVSVATLNGSSINTYISNAQHLNSFSGYLVSLVPATIESAFVKGDIIQVLLISLIFGAALTKLGHKGQGVAGIVDEIGQVLFQIMRFIIMLAPLGVLGAIAFSTATSGVSSLKQLGFLVAITYVSCGLFIVGILGSILAACGLNIFKFLNYIRSEITIVLATNASDSVFPQLMSKLEFLGVRKSTVGLVMSSGYSFNLDGQAIYLTLAVLFIAQATNTYLSWHDLIIVLLISLVTSKGVHAMPGSAIVVLAATLTAIPAIPAVALVLILPVDWIIGMARAVTNICGNCIATVVVAVWEKDLNLQHARQVLNGERILTGLAAQQDSVPVLQMANSLSGTTHEI